MPTDGVGADRPRRRVRTAVGRRSRCAAARIAPSASKAIADVGRARGATCPPASRFSRRSSTHFTGRADLAAPASMRHISSRWTMTFWPKPPPVSRMITRMRCSGMPSSRRRTSRTLVGRLGGGVDRELAGGGRGVDHEAPAPPSAPPRRPAGGWSRGRRGRPTAKTSSSVDGGRPGISPMRFEPWASCTRSLGWPRRWRSRPPRAAGRSRRRPGRRRPRRRSGSSATHERDRVADEADLVLGSGGRGVSGPAGRSSVCHCSWTPGFRSAAVNTWRTPGSAAASDASMPRIRGAGERAAHEAGVQHPGQRRRRRRRCPAR